MCFCVEAVGLEALIWDVVRGFGFERTCAYIWLEAGQLQLQVLTTIKLLVSVLFGALRPVASLGANFYYD